MATTSEVVLTFIQEFPGRDDDEIASALRISPRQQVNKLCRRLEKEGMVRREKGLLGKIGNYPAQMQTLAAPTSRTIPLTGPAVPPVLKEGDGILSLSELGSDRLAIVQIVLRHCLFPNPRTVASFRGAVFPSVRNQKNHLTIGEIDGRRVLLDDNVTPRWALLWAHGFSATHHISGWTFAHVWGASKDPDA